MRPVGLAAGVGFTGLPILNDVARFPICGLPIFFGGLIPEPGWDGIDQYQAAMSGWTTQTFDHEGVRVLHLRQMGTSHKSIIHGRVRRGRSGYYMGSHPIWMIASALFHLRDYPYAVASLATLTGYFGAMFARTPRVNSLELIRFIRKKQLSTLKSMWRVSSACRSAANEGEISWQQ